MKKSRRILDLRDLLKNFTVLKVSGTGPLELNSKNEQDSSKLVENPVQDDPLSEQELALENVIDQSELVKNPVPDDQLTK